jgi:hypothetical protein
MKANLFVLDDGHLQLTIEAENHVEVIALKQWSDLYFKDLSEPSPASLLITSDAAQLRKLRE